MCINADSETALMEKTKLLARFDEVANGRRIQMRPALMMTDNLPISNIVSGLASRVFGGF